MEGDHGEPPARREHRLGAVQRPDQLAELVIDRDAQALEGPRRRMGAARLAPDDAGDEIRELLGRRDRCLAPGFDDGARHGARASLLAIVVDDVGEHALIGLVDELGRALAARLHPHVERPVIAEREAALGLVELHRGDADIEHDAVERRHLEALGLFRQRTEARFGQGQPPAHRRDETGTAGDRTRVAVEREQRRLRLALQKRARIAAGAEGAVEIAAACFKGERVERLFHQHRDMRFAAHAGLAPNVRRTSRSFALASSRCALKRSGSQI